MNLLENDLVKSVYEKEPYFDLKLIRSEERKEYELVERGVVRLQNGSVYIGQWIKDSNTREGTGVIIYSDGTLY